MGKRVIPKLRFPEFINNWRYERLGKVSLLLKDGTHGTHKDTPDSGIYLLSAKNIKNNQILITKNEREISVSEYNSIFKNYSLKQDDILLTVVGTIGEVAKFNGNKNIAFQRSVAFFRFKNNSDFFLQQFCASNFQKALKRRQVVSAQPGIYLNDLSKILISLTSNEEQQKTATFLTAVDTKITQLTKKKALLEQYKKGIMQKIFNQELRFKDDYGNDYVDWEIKKLEDFILDFIVPMRDKPKSLDGDIPWCRIEDFDGKYLSKSKSNQGVTKETVKAMNLKVYPINTLLVSCSANLGFCAIVEKELITNQTFIGLYPNLNKINVDYLYHVMKLSSRELNVLSSGTTISYLSRKQFEKFKIQYPSIEEQTKIANFISAIDDKISHVTNQLEQTNSFKKGLLQQMFV